MKNKYQLAIIPADTILFRVALDKKIYESMFFAFEADGTGGSEYTQEPTQIWITRKPIISRLVVKGDPVGGKYRSDLAYGYNQFCGEEKDHIDVKSRHNPNRNSFLAFLKSQGMDSWVTSADNHAPMELHLFTAENKGLVKFKQTITEKENRTLINKNTFGKVILLNPNDHI